MLQRYVHISKLEAAKASADRQFKSAQEAWARVAELEEQVKQLQKSLEFARKPRFYLGRQATEAFGKPLC